MPRSDDARRGLPHTILARRWLSETEHARCWLPHTILARRWLSETKLARRRLPDTEHARRRLSASGVVPQAVAQPLGPWEAVHLAWQLGLVDPIRDGQICAREVGARNRSVLICVGGRPAVHAKQVPALQAADLQERDLLALAGTTRLRALMPRYLGWSGPPLFTVLTKGIDGLTGVQLMHGSFPAEGFRAIGRSLAKLHGRKGLVEVPCVTRQYLPTFFLATGAAGGEPLLALPLAEERLELLLADDGELPRPDRLRALLDRWTATSLIHADLRLRHVFARRRGQGFEITMCDWEDACAGDGIFDVGCLAASMIIEWYEGGLVLPELDLRVKLRSLVEGYVMARARFDPGTLTGYTGVALIQALAENQRYWTDQTVRHIWALAGRLVNEMDSVEIQRLIGAAP